MTRAEVAGESLRLVRRSLAHEPQGTGVYDDLLPEVCSYLASMCAGLLIHLGRATDREPEALLDKIEVKSMEKVL